MSLPSLEQLQEGIAIRTEIDNLNRRLENLFSSAPTRAAAAPTPTPVPAKKKATRHMTAAGRRRLSEAMTARWAARRAAAKKK